MGDGLYDFFTRQRLVRNADGSAIVDTQNAPKWGSVSGTPDPGAGPLVKLTCQVTFADSLGHVTITEMTKHSTIAATIGSFTCTYLAAGHYRISWPPGLLPDTFSGFRRANFAQLIDDSGASPGSWDCITTGAQTVEIKVYDETSPPNLRDSSFGLMLYGS